MFSMCSSSGKDPKSLYKGRALLSRRGATHSSSTDEKLEQHYAPARGRKGKLLSPFPPSTRRNGFRALLRSTMQGFLGTTVFWAMARGYLAS